MLHFRLVSPIFRMVAYELPVDCAKVCLFPCCCLDFGSLRENSLFDSRRESVRSCWRCLDRWDQWEPSTSPIDLCSWGRQATVCACCDIYSIDEACRVEQWKTWSFQVGVRSQEHGMPNGNASRELNKSFPKPSWRSEWPDEETHWYFVSSGCAIQRSMTHRTDKHITTPIIAANNHWSTDHLGVCHGQISIVQRRECFAYVSMHHGYRWNTINFGPSSIIRRRWTPFSISSSISTNSKNLSLITTSSICPNDRRRSNTSRHLSTTVFYLRMPKPIKSYAIMIKSAFV